MRTESSWRMESWQETIKFSGELFYYKTTTNNTLTFLSCISVKCLSFLLRNKQTKTTLTNLTIPLQKATPVLTVLDSQFLPLQLSISNTPVWGKSDRIWDGIIICKNKIKHELKMKQKNTLQFSGQYSYVTPCSKQGYCQDERTPQQNILFS